jgi:hypothetical protein
MTEKNFEGVRYSTGSEKKGENVMGQIHLGLNSEYQCGFGGLCEWYNDPFLDPEIWELNRISKVHDKYAIMNARRKQKQNILH